MAQLKDLIVSGTARILNKIYASEFVGKLTGNADTATNSDKLDGYHGSSSQSANTYVLRDSNGYANLNYINSNTGNNENPSISQVIVTNGNDNYYRKASLSHLKSSLGSMPASDVYAWAKASSKPSYSWDEITSKPSTFSPYFVNKTWYLVGDDVYIGDHDVGGGLGILGANGATRLDFCQYNNASNYKSISFDGTTLYLDGNCNYANTAGSAPANGGTSTYANNVWTQSHNGSWYINSNWNNTYFVTNAKSTDGSTLPIWVNNSGYADSAGNADTLDGNHASAFATASHTHSNYLTGITKDMVTNALGYTPPTSDTNTWRGISSTYTSSITNASTTSFSQEGAYNMYTAINSKLFQGKFTVLAAYTSHGWGKATITNIRNYRMIQILLRDANSSECASNITSPELFDDCNSMSRVFGAFVGTGDSNCALAYYINDTTVGIYLGPNFGQAILIGWY